MNVEHSIPPLRDLPSGRLAQRAHHLRAEVGRRQRKRSWGLAAAVAVAIMAVVVATPAFGLGDHIVHLFTASKQRPPELIQRYFANLQEGSGVLPAKARVAMKVRVPGYGTRTIWVAPTRSGGFCWSLGCDPGRKTPFHTTLLISGPTSRNSQPMPHSSNVHVFFEGDTLLHGAARVAISFEDGSSDRTPLVWVSRPIDAGFFVYELPREHWKVGKRPVALTVETARGNELSTDGQAPAYFLQSQALGLAPPPAGFPYRILWIVLAAAGGFLAAVLATAFVRPGWARRG